MAAVRRTNNDVKVEMEAATEDSNEAGNASDETDIEYNDEDIGEDHDDDDDKYLNQPLVPNETFNSKSNLALKRVSLRLCSKLKGFL